MTDRFTPPAHLISKVLILDDARADYPALKALCADSQLVGIRALKATPAAVMQLLRRNIDLGGILLHETFGGSAACALALARAIRKARPELPLFLRVADTGSMQLDAQDAALFGCVFSLADTTAWQASLESAIFSRVYPGEMVRNVAEMSQLALQTLFIDCDIATETPYLVKDRIIHGEVSTLIGIETSWCRGYMLLQTQEAALLALLQEGGSLGEGEAGFRELNSLLAEATNLIWGAFKNRYALGEGEPRSALQTQVPIVINHQSRYLSFGSDDPQLCLKYRLRLRNAPQGKHVDILQRFVFNLSWMPESYSDTPAIEACVEAGELELF